MDVFIESPEIIAPSLTIVGVDNAFLTMQIQNCPLVSCFSYYLARFLTLLSK